MWVFRTPDMVIDVATKIKTSFIQKEGVFTKSTLVVGSLSKGKPSVRTTLEPIEHYKPLHWGLFAKNQGKLLLKMFNSLER